MMLGWGDRQTFFAHPARLGLCVAAVSIALAAAASGLNLSSGRREDVGNRWIILPAVLLGFALPWLVAFTDRRDIFCIDGDAARYAGLAVFIAGAVLRVAPMFVLGHRFSGLVAIQERHQLETGGLYRVVRHPSYLGGLVALVGWVLVFRSAVGLLFLPVFVWLTIARIRAEEALLASEFGTEYAAYRARTWQLVPPIY